MVLYDHFRPPLSTRRHWHGFHNAWATYIAAELNRTLPEGYFAEPNVQFGIEIDVATFEEPVIGTPFQNVPQQNTQWSPQSPTQTILFQPTTDLIEVGIFNSQSGPTLAGAIELISPANKDRPTHRDTFTAKCQTYLQQGIGLIIIDVVTTLQTNLHDELIRRLNSEFTPFQADLYAVAYHAKRQNELSQLDLWQETLTLNQSLPTLPLWLSGGFCLPIALNTTYDRTCQEQRISP